MILFFTDTSLTREKAEAITDDALANADDGELFLEYRQSESIVFDDGRVKSASFDTAQGFGLRAVSGEATGLRPRFRIIRARIVAGKGHCSGGGDTRSNGRRSCAASENQSITLW